MRRWIGSNEHQFNVAGKTKCGCGDYILDYDFDRHWENCYTNPDNKTNKEEE